MQEGLPVLDGSNRGGDSLRFHTGPAARSCNLSMSEKDLGDFNERYRTKSTIFAGFFFWRSDPGGRAGLLNCVLIELIIGSKTVG